RVHRGREKAPLVERVEPGEGAEARSAGRLDCVAQPLHDPLGRSERDPRVGVRPSPLLHSRTLRPGPAGHPGAEALVTDCYLVRNGVSYGFASAKRSARAVSNFATDCYLL